MRLTGSSEAHILYASKQPSTLSHVSLDWPKHLVT